MTAAYTPASPLDLSKTPVPAFDLSCSLSGKNTQAIFALTLYSATQSFRSTCKLSSANALSEYAFNLSSCDFLSGVDKIEFSAAISTEKTVNTATFNVDKLRAYAVYDNVGSFIAQDGFYTAEGCDVDGRTSDDAAVRLRHAHLPEL